MITTFERIFNPAKTIQRIHDEFDSAQDNLLRQAEKVLSEIELNKPDEIELIGDRLRVLGFTSTPKALQSGKIKEKRAKQQEILVKTEQEANLIRYYKQTYPFLKFLTESELNRICEKYDLVYAPVGAYKEEVPYKNLCEIERTQSLNSQDVRENILKLHYEAPYNKGGRKLMDAMGHPDFTFTQTQINEWLFKAVKYDAPQWTTNGQVNTWLFAVASQLFPEINASERLPYNYNKVEIINRDGLFICAPETHFDKTGLTKKGKHGWINAITIPVKDPIVFRYCKGGIQVLSKWGLEANDPALTVESLN